ncbi:MAG: hypothetical protein ABIJ31_12430 [Pseudomonadota bacterium]
MAKKGFCSHTILYLLFLSALFLIVSASIVNAAGSDIVNIPDPKLKEALLGAGIDTNNDGYLTESEMAGLRELNAPLIHGTSGITNLSGLEYAASLGKLNISGDISDLTPLATLVFLNELRLQDNIITDLTPLADLIQLELLLIDGNPGLTDLSPLSNMNRLETLYIARTAVSDLSQLNVLTDLKTLDISETDMTGNLSIINTLTRLEVIYMANNGINDLTGVQNFPNLKYITFENCNISTLLPLEGLAHLESINCANNIIDVSPGSTEFNRVQSWLSNGVFVKYLPQKTMGALSGEITITGTISFGNQILAEIQNDNSDSDNFMYTWYREGIEIPGTNQNQYTLVEDDIGTMIKVKASTDDRSGSIESAPTSKVKKASQPKPTDLLISDLTVGGTQMSITVPNPAYEYLLKPDDVSLSIGDVFIPGTNPVSFNALTPNTEYDLYYRVSGTPTHYISPSSLLEWRTLTGSSTPKLLQAFILLQLLSGNSPDSSAIQDINADGKKNVVELIDLLLNATP